MGEFILSRDKDVVEDSFKRFIDDLKTAGVKGVALLAVDESPAPLTLLLEIMMDIVPEGQASRNAFDKVADAELRFSEQIEQFGLPVSMSFVNTAGTTMDVLEPKVRERWARDSEQLLEFIKL